MIDSPQSEPVALVTGASRGLGRAIAVELAGRGQHVVVNYKKNRREAEETLRQIAERGGSAALFQADVSQPDQVQLMFQAVFKARRRLDVLVNNAGVTRDEYFVAMRQQSWDEVIANDLGSALYCCKMAVGPMAGARRGVIVNIGSSAALSARPGQVNYGTAKSALLGFSRTLARELAGKGIRVLVVVPGFTATPMTEALPREVARETLARIPLQRWGTAEEIARAVAFFSSDAARCYSGQTIVIDGGRTAFEQEYGL
ncbi:MAG TPA: 3-oxoacyl-ACP reductase family protein [Candidatus Competibacter sp.]|nr:3-oxoacyl-ACP reductase family protein [Candidatus Competibacter sp.]HUM95570.1 3-oxoacyl-ACP reductase family protein [Candidatus Competibacter sp.]